MYRGNENAKTAHWLSEHKHLCIILVYGKSLSPVIKSAQPVVVEPIDDNSVIGKDDIVFCRVQKRYRLRKVITVIKSEQYSVGDNHDHINDTIGRNAIYGRAVRILRSKKKKKIKIAYNKAHKNNWLYKEYNQLFLFLFKLVYKKYYENSNQKPAKIKYHSCT